MIDKKELESKIAELKEKIEVSLNHDSDNFNWYKSKLYTLGDLLDQKFDLDQNILSFIQKALVDIVEEISYI